MAFIGPVSDRVEIRELVESYNDAVNRRDSEAWTNTWAKDASWNLMGMVITDRDAIVETWTGAISAFSYIGFTSFPGAIVVDGDTATARIYVRETLISNEGQIRNIEGLYEDDLVKTSGQWVFSKRTYKILHETTSTKDI